MATCGEYLVQILASHGIDTIFGIPGVHTVELYRGLPNAPVRHITPRHEQGAGFMADGYARASGQPAACFIITGPGLTNIATALGQAYADSVPILVISSVNNSHEMALGEGRLHELPCQRNLMAGLTAFSHTLLRPDELPAVLERAQCVFNGARPRPVHIEIPLDVIVASADHLSRATTTTRAAAAPDREAIRAAAKLLSAAASPMVWLGGGAQDGPVEARRLVEALGAPVVTTINGKGLLPPGHPLSLGSTIPQLPVLDALAAADVVLAIGTEMGETDTLLFDGALRLSGKLIRIDIDPEQLTRNAMPAVAIVSDAKTAMADLADALDAAGHKANPPLARITALKAELAGLLDVKQRNHAKVFAVLQTVLPGVIIVGDSTQPIYSSNLFYEPEGPRSFFNSSTGYGTLGYALPAALGAKLAMPHRPVVSVIGDGGLQFTIAELATAVELGLPVPILVWNNQGYGEIKRYMAERGIPQIGVDIYTPDFQTIARGFGCNAVEAQSLDHLAGELKKATTASMPTLIEIDEARALGW